MPPPPGCGGRGKLAGKRGVGRVPIPTRGHPLWYSLYICTLCSPPFASLSPFFITLLFPFVSPSLQAFSPSGIPYLPPFYPIYCSIYLNFYFSPILSPPPPSPISLQGASIPVCPYCQLSVAWVPRKFSPNLLKFEAITPTLQHTCVQLCKPQHRVSRNNG